MSGLEVEAVPAAVGPLGVPVEVRVVREPPWTPERMDHAAAASLGFGQR